MRRLADSLRRFVRQIRDERGMVLVALAGGMLAVLSVASLAMDVGSLITVRVQAQRAADAAALAGAGGFAQSPGNAELARSLAVEYGAYNKVAGTPPELLEGDVVIDTDALTVKATVYRVAERGTAVPTFFARVFGIDAVDVAATATAWAAPAGGVNCLLPVAVPDRWREGGGVDNNPREFNPELGDVYIPWVEPGSNPVVYNDGYTGYSDHDLGDEFTLKSNTGNGDLNQSWYYPYRPTTYTGAEDYETGVATCVDPSIVFTIGMTVDTEPGNMAGPTMKGFTDLINLDPTARWNDIMKCVVDEGYEGSTDVDHCRTSLRIRPLPMFDPREEPDLGAKPFKFTNFAGIFVERIEGKTVYARWVGYTGVNPAAPGEVAAGPLFKVVQLID